MIPTRELTRTEQRLAEVEALVQSLDQLAEELASYKEGLLVHLDSLRRQPGNGAEPVPAARLTHVPPSPVPKTPLPSSPVTKTPTPAAPPAAAKAKEPWQRTRATFQGDAQPMPEPEAAPSAPRHNDSGLRRGLAAAAADIDLSDAPVRPGGGSGARRTPEPAESPPELRRSDSGFRKTAPPLPEPPRPLKKTDSGTRRGGKPISILITDLNTDEEPVSGWVVERTANTLRLLVDAELNVGCVYSIRPSKDHPNAEWVQVSVKSCVQERSSYAVLAQFVVRPPWTALALL